MGGLSQTIRINSFLKSRTTTRGDGEALRKHLLKHWDDVDYFEIDFQSLQVASVSFLDEAFGMLAQKYGKRELNKKLRFVNMDEFDDQVCQMIVASRLRQHRKLKTLSNGVK